MINKIFKFLYYDKKRNEDEYKIVKRVLERMNSRSSLYLPLGDFKDQREFDYNDLDKIPDKYWSVVNANKELQNELQSYKERVASFSSVIDTVLYQVEKRYELKKKEEHET
jgi:hypothetical protein